MVDELAYDLVDELSAGERIAKPTPAVLADFMAL